MVPGIPFSALDGALTPTQCLALITTWTRLQQVAIHEVEHRLDEVVQALAELCDGEDGFLLVVQRDPALPDDDPLYGWRPVRLDNPISSPMRSRAVAAWLDDPDNVIHDPGNQLVMTQAGLARGYLFEDLVSAHGQQRAPTRALFEALGLRDRLIVGVPIHDALEVFIGLDRHLGSPPFTVDDRNLLVVAASGLTRLWTGFARSLGALDARAMLTRRERDALHGLLEGLPLADIAQRLAISVNTVRQYTRSLYHKFDVANRAELAALWLCEPGC